jgi:hypothetical protein
MHCSPDIFTNGKRVKNSKQGLPHTHKHNFPTWAGTKSFSLYLTGSNGLPLPNIARPYMYTYNLVRHVCLDMLFKEM